MFLSIFITIAAIHPAHPNVSSDKFPCTGPDRDAASILHLTEGATLWNQKEWTALLDSQMDEMNSAIDWMLNIVGLMIWTVSQKPNKMQNEQHKKDNKSTGTWTTVRDKLN